MKRIKKSLTGLAPLGITLVITVNIVCGFALRFSTSSKLWLDEALGVNIASAPLGEIVRHLRNDGAPPLYYFLLHFWISIFGSSDSAVRSLSGLFSLLGCVVAFSLARRLWGSRLAWITTAVIAILPYEIYFATEARMYSLVMLEAGLLLLVWHGDWTASFHRRAAATMALSALLLYTHYWSLYLLVALLIGLVIRILKDGSVNREIKHKAFGLSAGFLLWTPWLPIFNAQRLHTGTPWAPAPAFFQFFNWVEGFVVNQSRQHVTPSLHHQASLLLFVALLILGCFALLMGDRPIIQLDFRIPQDVKYLVGVTFGTMLLGLLVSHFTHTTFVARYASVIAIPIALLVARGISVFEKPVRILLVLLLFSGGALWTDKWGRGVQRTQAGEVSAMLANAKSDAYVYVCPDQLGPSVLRYSRSDLEYSSYPRFTNPTFVNWYDYKKVIAHTSPAETGQKVLAAAANRDIYVVWSAGYTLKATCKTVVREIAASTNRTPTTLLKARFNGFYQSMNVTFLPAN
jgi:mannosyltransferase